MANYKNTTEAPEMPILRALADENRVRALLALRAGELCVCQLIALLGLAPSTVSKHLSILKQAGLVAARKEGRWIYYRLPEAGSGSKAAAAVAALAFLEQMLGESERIVSDRRELRRLLKLSMEEVCRIALPRPGCCSSAPEIRAAAKWRRDGRGSSKAT